MFVVGYPRSGNTWLCYLLAYSLNVEYDDLDEPGVHPRTESQRRYVKGGLPRASYEAQVGRVLKTHALRLDSRQAEPVIYLVRDGRDVMASYYFYARASERPPIPLSGWRALILRAFRRVGLGRASGSLVGSSFSRFLWFYAMDWATHVRTWMAKSPRAVVRYEDLHAEPRATLAAVHSALGVPVSPRIIAEAVELFDFEHMSGRQPGSEDAKAFLRKGSTRDWTNRFSEQDLERFDHDAGDVLRSLGYALD